jgi:predicted RNase H-like HicB family nuclease
VIDTSEQDEDDAWSAQAILAPGIATVGEGDTREQAVEECNKWLELLIDELRASA